MRSFPLVSRQAHATVDLIEAYAVFEVEPAAIFQQVECVNADAPAICHGDRDSFPFRVDVYEVEGDELFSVIELECAQFRRRILCGRIDFREGR